MNYFNPSAYVWCGKLTHLDCVEVGLLACFVEVKESFFSAFFSPNRENVHYVENLSTDIVDKQQAHRSYVHNVENLSTAIVEILMGK